MRSLERTRLRAGVAIATGVGVAVLVILFFPWNLLRGPISDHLSRSLDRPVSIAGDLTVQFGWTPQIQADDVSIGNLHWSTDATMAHVQRVRVRVEVLSLFGDTPVLRTVELVEPQLLLEKNRD